MRLLRRFLVFVVLSTTLVIPETLFALENIRNITVTGESKAVVEPHYAIIRVNMRHANVRMTVSHEQLIQSITALIDALKSAGLTNSDIKKSMIRQGQEFSWEANRRVLKGYFSESVIELHVRNIERIYSVYKTLSNYPQLTILSTEYKRNDEFELRKAVTEKALLDARKKAEYMAAALQVRIGKVHSIQQGGQEMRPVAKLYAQSENRASDEATSDYGTIEVTAAVIVEFELE